MFISVNIFGTDKWFFYEVKEDFTVQDLKESVALDTAIPVREQRICACTATERGSSFNPVYRTVTDFTNRPEGLLVLRAGQQLGADGRQLNDTAQVPDSCVTSKPKPRPAPEASCCAGIRSMCSVM
mmetsp:Transcript_34379/g.93104  ORF Transcript_34379/g.93104 Transcript_34379/m.93104 type:complete len:126 (-) Transcript_34379:143-520(-)